MVLYENLVTSGRIKWDEKQVRLLVQLRRIHQTLVDYEPSQGLRFLLETAPTAGRSASSGSQDDVSRVVLPNFKSGKSLVKALIDEDDLSTLHTPTGFMLTGSVGTGKTMLLDLFYQSLPVKKQRIHYHAFLLSLYRKVFVALEQQRLALDQQDVDLQQQAMKRSGYRWDRREENKANALSKGWQTVFAGGRKHDDPALVKEFVLAKIALDLIKESTVLAFDEVQLVDIAGAGILRRVLTWYWRLGGVVVATSNRLPSDLYQQGIQQEQFQSFLGHLSARCPPYEIRSTHDWRRQARISESAILDGSQDDGMPSWIGRLTAESTWFTERAAFDQCLKEAVGDAVGRPKSLTVYGREVEVPEQVEGQYAKFAFKDLCEKALGPADFLSITSSYPTIIITDIPQLKLTQKNEARRFITFLDAAYESKSRLICQAAAEPDHIFFPDAADLSSEEEDSLAQEMIGDVLQDLQAPYRPNISSYSASSEQESPEERIPTPARKQGAVTPSDVQGAAPAFRTLAIFTGQDEQFAYKRALSRIFEITSKEYVKTARFTPIRVEDRVWEQDEIVDDLRTRPIMPVSPSASAAAETSEGRDPPLKYARGQKVDPLAEDLDVNEMPKPRIGSAHFWGIIDSWGVKAGKWGRGVRAKQEEEKQAK